MPNIVSLSSPLRIALLTAGYKVFFFFLFSLKNKLNRNSDNENKNSDSDRINKNACNSAKQKSDFRATSQECSLQKIPLELIVIMDTFSHYIFLDIDECSTNSHSCDTNAVCSNTDGSYTCPCNSGYSGDGKTCTGKLFLVLSIREVV